MRNHSECIKKISITYLLCSFYLQFLLLSYITPSQLKDGSE